MGEDSTAIFKTDERIALARRYHHVPLIDGCDKYSILGRLDHRNKDLQMRACVFVGEFCLELSAQRVGEFLLLI
jgi:hypothetical protein